MKHQFNLFYSLEKLLSNTAFFFFFKKKKHAHPGGKGAQALPLFASFLSRNASASRVCVRLSLFRWQLR